MTDNMWGYPAESGHRTGTDLVGFKVEASDGSIGKVDKHSEDVGAAYIVVDTGVWIFGKQVLLPAGVISSIDVAERTIHVGRTKDEIKNSPSSTRTSTSVTPATTSSSAATTGTTEPDRHSAAHGGGHRRTAGARPSPCPAAPPVAWTPARSGTLSVRGVEVRIIVGRRGTCAWHPPCARKREVHRRAAPAGS